MSAEEARGEPHVEPSSCGEQALGYARRGWRVLPLHTPTAAGCTCERADCRNPGKHPRIRGWRPRATADAAQITDWWLAWSDANVGIVLGRESGIVVLDIDPRNGGDDALHELERTHGALPRTPSVKSGSGGSHVYFRAPAIPLVSSLGPGLDLLGDGKLIVAPPSLHASGSGYEWDEHPDDVELAALPNWIVRSVTPARVGRVASRGTIPQGERNVTLTQIAGSLRLVVREGEAIAAALHAINDQQCRPPLPRNDVEQIARSAQRWPSLPWLTSPRAFFADERLSANARHVLRTICDFAASDGTCWPTHTTIARQTGISSSTTISKAIAELEATGRITVARRSRKPNLYRINRSLPQLLASGEAPPLVLTPQDLEAAAGRHGG